MRRLITEEFKNKLALVNDKIDVVGEYVTLKIKIKCKCKVCGNEWEALSSNLLKGKGCPECKRIKLSASQRKTTELFIEEAKKVHGDFYDYSKVEYKTSHTKVCIICPIHGEFWQDAVSHLQGHKCQKCTTETTHILQKFTTEDFITKAKAVHGDKYDYSKVIYSGIYNPVTIICPKHGDFLLQPNKHINSKHGCPICASSHGEEFIYNYLKTINIDFTPQYKCKLLNRILYADFYLEINNNKYIIEYNGIQHYKPVEYFGGENQYKLLIDRDLLLKNYCAENNILYVEVSYLLKDSEIVTLLNNLLNE